jgi:hypothetical protein
MSDLRDETEAWAGDGLRREAFFFPSGGERLFGSLYAAVSPPPRTAVTICNSWGFEGNQADRNCHLIALRAARGGGAGTVFHYPGFGDSEGDLATASVETLVDAAVDAVAATAERVPGTESILAGLMFGASVAALAAARAGVRRLLLIQPVLEPSRYFARLERSARRAAVRVPARAGNAYGYPLPRRILEAGPANDAAVAAALREFEGSGALLRYAEPPRSEAVPDRFEEIVLPGTWRFGARQKPEVAKAAAEWLRGTIEEAAE